MRPPMLCHWRSRRKQPTYQEHFEWDPSLRLAFAGVARKAPFSQKSRRRLAEPAPAATFVLVFDATATVCLFHSRRNTASTSRFDSVLASQATPATVAPPRTLVAHSFPAPTAPWTHPLLRRFPSRLERRPHIWCARRRGRLARYLPSLLGVERTMNPSTNATACPTIAASASALGTAAGHQQQHSRPTRGPSPPAPHISSLAPASSSDSVLVEAFSPAHLAMTETGPSSSNNDPAVSYPWQMGTMSCLHRRSSCSTLDSFSVARDSNTIGSHIGDNGDNTSAISDTFGNPFQFSLCPANTAWAASHLESGSGYIPPRPVSAPSLTTTAIAQDNGLSRAADNGMGSHSNSYIITTAPLDSTITSCSILPDTVDSGLSDLAMPPSSLPILAVSAIPDLPGITSASDLRAGSGASTWSNNVWSLATTAGLTSVPLGCDTMEFEGGLDDLKQSDLTDKTQKLLHQTQLLQQFQASLADLRQLGIGMQELDHREDKSSWRLPFEATKSTYSGMSFSHPGSTYSSSLPSSSGVSSPESSSAAAVFCGLPTLRENSLHMPMDEQQSQE